MSKIISVATLAVLAIGATAASAQNIPARNANHNGPGHQVTNYPYVEGGSYVSPYVNATGHYSGGKNPDSRCYHGNFGYNGQTSNYDHSSCVVVYDAQTYVRLLRGSSPRGGTSYWGN
ncbi:MAG: hypothetical protein COB84_00870 [Rhodobacteraceae bacterium]|nr:MAG: hypothetical protein COB84_00870 [Paracoccaceae bacterium]